MIAARSILVLVVYRCKSSILYHNARGIIHLMNVYFAGIGGVALGPLAEIARDLGYTVSGSDPNEGLMTKRLVETGVTVSIDQSGGFLQSQHLHAPIDWFIYTSA